MIGSFLTRALALVLGYAYPAYECYKTVELNKPEIDQLRFWCQYWILVAGLTVFERVGDTFVSWLPMYSEAKLAFFVYLWYPKTRGTTYVYETFFRPYVAKHETEIDRNLLELRTRAGDMVVLYWQKVAGYGQTRFFEILQYVASQSQSQSSRQRPTQQRQQPPQVRQAPAAAASRQPPISQQPQQPARAPPVPASPTKSQPPQEPTKAAGPSVAVPAAAQSQSSLAPAANPSTSSETSPPTAASEGDKMQVESSNADSNPPPQETPIEEAVRVTRARLRKKVAAAGPSIR